MNGNVNVLMCVQVAMLLPEPHQQAYLRCGGQVGYNAFEELVALQLVPLRVQVKADILPSSNPLINVPVIFSCTMSHSNVTLIYTHRARVRHGQDVGYLNYPLPNIMYEWDTETESAPKNFSQFATGGGAYMTTLNIFTIEGFGGVLWVECGFLSNSSLRTIEFDSLKSVIQLDDRFLGTCARLQTLNLSDMTNISHIGSSFLVDCKSLTTIQLPPLSHVTHIGSDFMKGCAKLESIHLDLNNLNEVPPNFMADCWLLKSVVITGLHTTTDIRNYFLSGCRSLTSLQLPPLTKVTCIGGSFLVGCKSLKTVSIRGLGNVHSIHGGFLRGCVRLHADIDFTELVSITTVGPEFMTDCPTTPIPTERDALPLALSEALEIRLLSARRRCSIQ